MIDNIKKVFGKNAVPHEDLYVVDKGMVTICAGTYSVISKLRKKLEEEGDNLDIQKAFYKEPIYYLEVV
jgi:hypothetical protein